ncbi:hypothetical protein K4039_14820 [Lyngbya sp. CCAP 1446/10]|uniref:hypothetical protein n=1 Tax=Lyngbya sp. CCAP 1446/10 TaxID=439293 RepID=UPI0022381B4B|nr:hypothetical protein [Lyngbya sp. CCAP 1446/10]MCW6051326.1 hypothetical protein [Lyngbya sp. CCAP 1446/10]
MSGFSRVYTIALLASCNSRSPLTTFSLLGGRSSSASFANALFGIVPIDHPLRLFLRFGRSLF